MKTTAFCFVVMLASFACPAAAQVTTATNIVAYDCSGTLHNLFDELDAGKIVILNWVMPCWGCIGPTQTSYDVAHSYGSTHPGKVQYYLIDDYGNTACPTLGNWVSSNIVGTKMKIFSDSTILWSDYGEYGMPKIVVVGSDHQIYYNGMGANASAEQDIHSAIDAALEITGIGDVCQSRNFSVLQAGEGISIQFEPGIPPGSDVQVFDAFGKLIAQKTHNAAGTNRVDFQLNKLPGGVYLVRLSMPGAFLTQKFIHNP